MQKQKVFKVEFFVQQGMLMGGPHESETVIAPTKQEAVDKLKKERGNGFRLCSVEEIGAQG